MLMNLSIILFRNSHNFAGPIILTDIIPKIMLGVMLMALETANSYTLSIIYVVLHFKYAINYNIFTKEQE